MATLKGSTIAGTFDQLVQRAASYAQTGTNIELMDDTSNATAQATGLYLESGATTSHVGIGNSAPAAALHIETASEDGNILLTQQASDAGTQKVMWSAEDDAARGYIGYKIHASAASDSGMEYSTIYGNHTFIGAGGATLMTIDAYTTNIGNVGIGTATPAYKLEVEGEDGSIPINIACYSATVTHVPYLQLQKSAGSTPGSRAATADDEDLGKISFNGVNSAAAWDEAATILCEQDASSASNISGRLTFSVANASSPNAAMTILSSGNVGIGTTAPISHLEVRSATSASGSLLSLTNANVAIGSGDVLGRINFSAPLETQGGDGAAVAASIAAVAQATFNASINSTALFFQTGDSEVATTKMVIDEDGFVGIGVTGPAYRLDVKHDIEDNYAAHIFNNHSSGGYGLLCKAGQTANDPILKCEPRAATTTNFQVLFDGGVQSIPVYSKVVTSNVETMLIDDGGEFGRASSSKTFKTNIKSMDDVSWLMDVNPVTFEYKKEVKVENRGTGVFENEGDGIKQHGLIAEELWAIAPEICSLATEEQKEQYNLETDAISVRYELLVPALIKAVQELSTKVTALENA